MKNLSNELFRVQRVANIEIGNLKTPSDVRKKLRALTFDLIDFEDNILNYSDIAIRARIAAINSMATSPALKINSETVLGLERETIDFKLTKKELEILRLLPEGLSIKELAEKLFLTQSTVKTHLSAIYRKLAVSNRVQAISKAKDFNLLTL